MGIKIFSGLMDVTNKPETFEKIQKSSAMKQFLNGLAKFFKIINALPWVRDVHPWIKKGSTELYALPINKELERGENVVVPYQIVEEFIEKSTYRMVMDFCGCRTGNKCKNHPQDFGCLLMGEATEQIKIPMSRKVSKNDAKEHLQKAIDSGLTVFVGFSRVDNFIFGLPDDCKLLSVCFCCDCCCMSYMYKYMPSEKRNDQIRRLEGLEVWVDKEKCKGCGKCAKTCFLDLPEISDDKAHIPEDCRGCGRCAKNCPNDAIHLRLNNPDFVNQVMSSIERKVTA